MYPLQIVENRFATVNDDVFDRNLLRRSSEPSSVTIIRHRVYVDNPKHLGRKLRKLRRLEREKSRRQKEHVKAS